MDNFISENNALSTGQLVQSRVDLLSGAGKFSGVARQELSTGEKAEIANASRGFEAMFIHMLMKDMKDAMLGADRNSNDSLGAGTLEGYTDLLFAEELSRKGTGIGIAETMYKQLTGESLSAITKSGNVVTDSAKLSESPSTAQVDRQTTAQSISEMVSSVTGLASESADTNNLAGTFVEKLQSRLSQYEPIISQAAETFGIPDSLIKAVITTESAGKADAKSAAGAKGLMQLMDATAGDLGVTDSYDPEQNIMGGAKYLSQMLGMFGGDLDKALAAYNAGPGNVQKYDGVPPFSETQSYIVKVNKYLNMFGQTTDE